MRTRLTGKHRIDQLESIVDLLSDLGPCQDDLAADEDQEHDLRLDHTVDETREEFRLIRAEMVMAASKPFESNRELDVARANDVLDFKVRELCVEPKLLNNPSVFTRRQLRVVFRLGTSDDHLARGKDQSCSLRFTDAHDDGRETLERVFSTK